VIEIKQVGLKYQEKLALNNISLRLNENQLIGLIGRNGCGKTTFMKLCAGLLEPTDGQILVLNENPMNQIDVLKEIIYSYPNIPHNASNTLQIIFDYFNMFYPRFDQIFSLKLLEVFSLKPSMKYKSLSQGMKSVFNYICALSTRAKITLFDEPILGMDVTVRKKVYEILLRDYMEYPRTIIVSSHILSELEDILSEILLLDHGTIMFYKDMEEVSSMAYRVDGSEEAVRAFVEKRAVLYEDHKTLGSFAIIESQYDEIATKEGKDRNLTISKVRPEELCIYKTIHGERRIWNVYGKGRMG
jgi:ABC-2 type transport system ATP-binding protein